MRFIRLLFVAVLAVILLAIALANRGAVTVRAFPAGFEQYLGFDWQISLPLFLVIFLAIVFGIVVGFIWEWLREAHIRSAASRRKTEVDRLEREVGQLRERHNAPNDDVLAILDNSQPTAPVPGTTLPATR
ncbi:MAG: LapA family protein [Paracoccus denitrificans]|uniref:LapA family protein n=1 Tax=Paracoccus denitrificans TaxID=266 RepID=A0A533I7Q1_PARDE|nr:MAG: LapA family protein [Paracoccus denitrificans]